MINASLNIDAAATTITQPNFNVIGICQQFLTLKNTAYALLGKSLLKAEQITMLLGQPKLSISN